MVRYLSLLLPLALQATLGLATCPNITLPWGLYQSAESLNRGTICVYKNVRFGKKPVRFQKPQPPDTVTSPSLQPTQAPACYQVKPGTCKSKTSAAIAEDGTPPFTGPLPGDEDEAGMSEDCLFADLYVPASALNAPFAKLPVVIWFYGGGFIFGSKDTGTTARYDMPFYSGQGLLSQGHDFIFVAGNYRMGAFGWLAGPTVVHNGAANAGLWDQRLLVDFVTNYIDSFGGRADSISLWGESAGAGSILHQLTSSPPISNVQTVLLQSPAYLWQWNPKNDGYPAAIYDQLTTACKCNTSSDTFKCLQKLPVTQLQACNANIINSELQDTGLIPFNPAIDEVFIKDLPTVSFQKGNFAPLKSLLVSHVLDESKTFIPCYVTTNSTMDKFEQFLGYFMPGDRYRQQRAATNSQYPASSFSGDEGAWNRAHAVIQDSSFTCNTRFIFDAYYNTKPTTPAYMMHYSFFGKLGYALHASDLMPTYWNQDLTFENFTNFMNDTINPNITRIEAKAAYSQFSQLSPTYQSYLASFATVRYPTASGRTTPYWYPAHPDANGDQLEQVMDVSWGPLSYFHGKFVDSQNSETVCSFWRNMSSWVENAVGIKSQETAMFQAQGANDQVQL